MATRNNVINILTPQEKNLFLQIKEKFNKAEDRTIYVRLLFVNVRIYRIIIININIYFRLWGIISGAS